MPHKWEPNQFQSVDGWRGYHCLNCRASITVPEGSVPSPIAYMTGLDNGASNLKLEEGACEAYVAQQIHGS